MASSMDIKVNVSGPLFTKDIVKTIEKAVIEEAIDVLDARIMLTGKKFSTSGQAKQSKKTGRQVRGQGLGVMRNTLSERRETLKSHVSSTLIPPRTVGTSWIAYNMGIAKSLVPRVVRKTADRIVRDLD